MIDNIEYYMEYLDGLTKDMPEEFVKLAQVFELSVFGACLYGRRR